MVAECSFYKVEEAETTHTPSKVASQSLSPQRSLLQTHPITIDWGRDQGPNLDRNLMPSFPQDAQAPASSLVGW